MPANMLLHNLFFNVLNTQTIQELGLHIEETGKMPKISSWTSIIFYVLIDINNTNIPD